MINNKLKSSKAQVTVFIIVSIVIVVLFILLFWGIKSGLFGSSVPDELEPVYSYYLSCIDEEVMNGANLLGRGGGYIDPPDFSSGSYYMPFSNQLDFLGEGVAYWSYISGNGVAKEQVPVKEKMEEQLENFVEEKLKFCDFTHFSEQGFNIKIGEIKDIKTNINEKNIEVSLVQDLSISHEDVSWSKNSHKYSVDSYLGKFYDLAKKIYVNNKENMFLENYGVDILRLYSPVDGSEIGCEPKIWSTEKVRENLISALEANIPFTKIKGNYYKLSKEENKYFVQDIGENVNENINFLFLREWPMKIQVWPSEGDIMRAEPVGIQEGLGMLGFCYVNYHFVYDFAYPVLIQIYSGDEIFQFPVVVYIEKNEPRKALNAEGLPNFIPELCDHRNTEIKVSSFNSNLNLIDSDISFKCFDASCYIGRTNKGSLVEKFPQCVNGFIIASAEGYETKKKLVSTVYSDSFDIVLNKEYALDLLVSKNGEEVDKAIVIFNKNTSVRTISYPEMKKFTLSAGQYEIKTYIYSDTNINLKGSSKENCIDVPKSGVLGVLGFNDKKCVEVNIDDQIVSSGVSGGGRQNYFISESELKNSRKMIINADDFNIPYRIEDLQSNYNKIEDSRLNIEFK